MNMKLRDQIIWVMLALFAVTAVQGSLLVKQSLLRPRLPEPCFTSRAEDRPLAYTLVAYFNKIKDMLVRGLSVLTDNTASQLDFKL